jgi:surfeit locus 1 family protein
VFATVAVVATFLALGTWQVQRRAWKLALIERVEQRVAAPAAAAPGPERWAEVNAANDEYRHVRATGRFRNDVQVPVQAVTELGAGFWVLTPLELDDGSTLLVNRGFVAPEWRDRPAPAEGRVTVTGLLRLSEPGGGFLRRNDAAAGRWYSRDVAAIAAARGLRRVAPYFVDADSGGAAGPEAGAIAAAAATPPGTPIGGLTVVAFHNSHAVYAFTWYTLALMAAAGGWRLTREEPRDRQD